MPPSPAPPAGPQRPPAAASDLDASAALSAQFHIDSCSTLHAPGRPAACQVLVVAAHSAPQSSRVNRKLIDAASAIDGVWVDDLYETYPDFYIDVVRERALLAGADTLVLLFPTQWYAAPALLKEWCDVVLHDAWQGSQRKLAPQRLPRRCWIVTSTGSPAADFAPGAHHGRPFADFLAPLLATARVCGMDALEPLVLHGAHEIDAAAVDAHVAHFTAQLEQLVGAARRRAAHAAPAQLPVDPDASKASQASIAMAPRHAARVRTGERHGD